MSNEDTVVDTQTPPIPISGYITDLLDEQIRVLTTADLERMIALKKASEGVRMLKEPALPALHEVPPKDMTIYTVSCLEYCGFLDRDKAMEAVASLEKTLKEAKIVRFYTYQDKLSSREEYTPDLSIRANQAYSPELYAKVKVAIEENESMKKEYEKAHKAWEEAESESEWISNEVYGTYNRVQSKYRKLDELVTQFGEYLLLAEGNQYMAFRFLEKAYPLTAEERAYIVAKTQTETQQ